MTCWEVICQERVLSPTLVLSLHVALAADVMCYRPSLRHAEDAWSKFLWLLMGVTMMLFFQTSLVDPGWLRPKGLAFSGPGACLLCPCSSVASACLWCLGGNRLRPPQELEAQAHGHAAREGDESAGGDALELAPIIAQQACDEEAGSSSQWNSGEGGIQKRRGQSLPDTPNSMSGPMTISDKEVVASVVGAASDVSAVGSGSGAIELSGSQRRWCKRCELYQPLRTKHCGDCGVCVRTHDHHCPWVGTCVGENNRVLFFSFLVSQATELAAFFTEGVKGISILDPSALLVFGLLVIAMMFFMVTCLLSFHSYLLLANLTTWEHVSWNRISYLKGYHCDRGSPFSRSMLGNVAAYCCGPSWCPERMRQRTTLRYEESAGIEWELGDPHPPNCLLRYWADCC